MPSITFKCTQAQKDELETRSEGNLSSYVKDILFSHMSQEDDLKHLIDLVEKMGNRSAVSPAAAPSPGLDSGTQAILIEMLLLMRNTVQPKSQREAQAEMERLGLPVWQADSAR